jgi:pimeloyl-ACP methyl ester carboxylesterase
MAQAGVIDQVATLTVMIRIRNTGTAACPPAVRLRFNGLWVDALDPRNTRFLDNTENGWVEVSVQVPISSVRFPGSRGENGPPIPAGNLVEAVIDGNGSTCWCVSAAWAALAVRVASPVIFIHGINSNGGFFFRRGIKGAMENAFFLTDNSISHPKGSLANPLGGRVVRDSKLLATEIPAIATTFGVRQVHLLAHSKGGLDAREFLAKLYPSLRSSLQVLSLTTLATPHDGSALADIIIARGSDSRVLAADLIRWVGFPPLAPALIFTMANIEEPSPGYADLRVSACARFAVQNVPQLPRDVVYSLVAGDMDLNGNLWINVIPDEFADLRAESSDLNTIFSNDPSSAGNIVDTIYQTLRWTRDVRVNVLVTPEGRGRDDLVQAFIVRLPNTTALGNDSLVALPSARALSSLAPAGLLRNQSVFTLLVGRNHSSIADVPPEN